MRKRSLVGFGWLGVLHVPVIAFMLDYSGFDFLSGEIFLQAKNSTGHKWDSNPGLCR